MPRQISGNIYRDNNTNTRYLDIADTETLTVVLFAIVDIYLNNWLNFTNISPQLYKMHKRKKVQCLSAKFTLKLQVFQIKTEKVQILVELSLQTTHIGLKVQNNVLVNSTRHILNLRIQVHVDVRLIIPPPYGFEKILHVIRQKVLLPLENRNCLIEE